MNTDVIAWYCDQIGSYIGIIATSVLLIIIAKKLNGSNKNHDESYAQSLRFWISGLYISSVLFMITIFNTNMILTIYPSQNNQFTICKINHLFAIPLGCIYRICIFNFFVERLNVSFKDSVFQLSKCFNYSIRIIYTTLWIIIIIIGLISADSSPYNIYQQQIDYNGHGVTCGAFYGNKPKLGLLIVIMLSAVVMFTGEIFIWSLFMYKLYKLTQSRTLKMKCELIMLIKEQTLIVALHVFSSIFSAILQGMTIFGNLFVSLAIISTTFLIFLSFNFNRYWFILFRCDILAICCCNIFCSDNISKNEKTLNEIVVTTQCSTTDANLSNDNSSNIAASNDNSSNVAASNDETIPTIIKQVMVLKSVHSFSDNKRIETVCTVQT